MTIIDKAISKIERLNPWLYFPIMFVLIGIACFVIIIGIGAFFYLLKLVFFTLAKDEIGGYFLILLWAFIGYKVAKGKIK